MVVGKSFRTTYYLLWSNSYGVLRPRRQLHPYSSTPARERESERERIPRPVAPFAPFAPFQHAQLESVVLGSWDPGILESAKVLFATRYGGLVWDTQHAEAPESSK
jgi:hypothetical protein